MSEEHEQSQEKHSSYLKDVSKLLLIGFATFGVLVILIVIFALAPLFGVFLLVVLGFVLLARYRKEVGAKLREAAQWAVKVNTRPQETARERASSPLQASRAPRRPQGPPTLAEMRTMEGREFERFLATVFRKLGYKVKLTPASGDQGADLLLYKDERSIAVQAKRWDKAVGNQAVRDIHAASTFYNTLEAWVITTGSFTKHAIDAARGMRVRLIDGPTLATWVRDSLQEES
jgi:restriction endonuclease Mrr